MEFVSFDLAKKLKEKGFNLDEPYSMYNEKGVLHKLYTSAGFDNVYDFDERDYISPTISQVLKWLRDNHKLHISTKPYPCEDGLMWLYEVRKFSSVLVCVVVNKTGFQKPEQAAIAGIEYVLDNLI